MLIVSYGFNFEDIAPPGDEVRSSETSVSI
jgi:hypothetical protein